MEQTKEGEQGTSSVPVAAGEALFMELVAPQEIWDYDKNWSANGVPHPNTLYAMKCVAVFHGTGEQAGMIVARFTLVELDAREFHP